MKQRIILTIGLLLSMGSMQAQINRDSVYFDKQKTTAHADDNEVVQKLGIWVRSNIYDNWYVSLQGGPSLYGGYQDYSGPIFGKNPLKDGHLSWNAEAKIGRWVFPVLGYRFGVGIGNFHGFLSRDTYNYGVSGSLGHDGGQGVAQDGYLGYFWETNDTNLLIQRWKYFNASGEMMIRFLRTKKYLREQKFIPYMMLGVNFYSSLSNGDKEESQDGNHIGAGIHAGAGVNWRLSDHWDAFAEARVGMMSGTFDREWISGIESPTFNEDFPVYLNIGAVYRFNWRREEKRNVWEQTIDTNEFHAARTDASHQFHYDIIPVYDTFYFEEIIDTGLSPEAAELLRRRAEQRAQDIVDSIQDALNRLNPDASLRDIFEGNLLPYEMVFFQLDKWAILPHEALKVRKMAQIIKSLPGQQFLLIGSADSKTGTVKRNEFLSVNRADVVYNQLVYEYGIDPTQLQRVYMGGILDYDPFELNRATVIILNHPKVMAEFEKLRSQRQAGGSTVKMD